MKKFVTLEGVHPSHKMFYVKGENIHVCEECHKCFCHRPIHLGYICPAVEWEESNVD